MLLKKSKKGITLVELVICCAIIVMLGGACTAVLASGSKIFNQSSRTASAQLNSDVLQTHMINLLPSAKNVSQITQNEAKNVESGKGTSLFLDSENVFTIRSNGSDTKIGSVDSFEYDILRAGSSTSTTAKAQLRYTVTFTDGSELVGGYVLSNVSYSQDISGSLSYADGSGAALLFNAPEAAAPTEP